MNRSHSRTLLQAPTKRPSPKEITDSRLHQFLVQHYLEFLVNDPFVKSRLYQLSVEHYLEFLVSDHIHEIPSVCISSQSNITTCYLLHGEDKIAVGIVIEAVNFIV